MDKCELIKEINTLRTLLKTRRIIIIRKLVRFCKELTKKAAATGDNRVQRKAENYVAVLNHIKTLAFTALLEKVIEFQPDNNGQPTPPSIEQRSIARVMEDEKLVHHLKSLESRFGKGDKSKLLDILKKKNKIKYSADKQKKPERIAKRIEKHQKVKQKMAKKKELRKKNTTSKPEQNEELRALKKKEKMERIAKRIEEQEKEAKQAENEGLFKKSTALKHKLDEEDELNTKEHTPNDSYESDENVERRFYERLNESDDSDEEELCDQQSNLSVSVTENDSDNSSEGEEFIEMPEHGPSSAKQSILGVKTNNLKISEPLMTPTKQSTVSPTKKRKIVKAPEEEDDEDELIPDSFFMTEKGERYVAVFPKLKPKTGDGDKETEEPESWKLVNRRKKRMQQRNEQDNGEELDTGLHVSEQGKSNKNFDVKGKFANEKQGYGSSTNINDDLHPSWAAKQAQKGIKPFAGKKIVFDGEDTSAPVKTNQFSTSTSKESDLHPSWAAKQAQKGIKPFAGKKIVFDGEDTNVPVKTNQFSTSTSKESDLHPSWAAKQAQKGIKPFAGKKIVFDGDDTSAPVKTNQFSTSTSKESDLHPSWAAKQAQKGIKPFAGKKIVFDGEDTNVPVKTNQFSTSTSKESDLHPSWAAKQAQKGIKPFAGKKIVFDGEDTSVPVKTNQFSTSTSKESDLHPSWAAKQAQKGIKPFAGKKIVFNVDEDNQSLAIKGNQIKSGTFNGKDDLHPSWAAKQAQQGIKQFAGKKVIFDDENIQKAQPAFDSKPYKSQITSSSLDPSWVAKQAQNGIKVLAGKRTTFEGNDDKIKINGTTKFSGKKIAFNDKDEDDVNRYRKTTKRMRLETNSKGTNLHPSWVAKQAQKVIPPFAGKKLSFGDDEPVTKTLSKSTFNKGLDNNNQANNSDLHPSWVAKQAQSGIKAFAGKKITFDTE